MSVWFAKSALALALAFPIASEASACRIGFDQVRGEQLAAALRGRSIVPRRSPLETPTSEQFGTDGTYVYSGHRIRAQGRYEILNDHYCTTTTVGAIRRCFSLHRDRDGQHYLRQEFPVASDYWPVQLVD